MEKKPSRSRVPQEGLPPQLAEAERRSNEILPAAEHVALAEVFARHGRVDKAQSQYLRAANQAQKAADTAQLVRALAGAADLHHQQGSFRTAIQNQARVVQLCQEGEASRLADGLNMLGLSHYRLGEYALALETFQRMLDALSRASPPAPSARLAAALLGCAGAAFQQAAYANAEEWAARALAVCHGRGDDQPVLEACLTLGNLSLCLKQPRPALGYYQRALDIAEKRPDYRNQCRALCGAGLCYYYTGEAAGAVKLFQNALACDKLVPAAPSGPVGGSLGDQLVDDQLLHLLHRHLKGHAPQGKTPTLMGTMYLGLTAVVMNGSGVLSPTSLPDGLIETVVRALVASAEAEPSSPTNPNPRLAPFLQHYCVHIIQQCVRQRALRPLVGTPEAADALLRCLAYPAEPAAGMQCHSAAYRTLRALLLCSIPGVSHEDIADLFLSCPALQLALDLLPRRTKPPHEARQRQVVDILGALTVLVQAAHPTRQFASSPRRSGAITPGTPDPSPILVAVCAVANLMLDSQVFVEADLQLLDLSFRLLLAGCRRLAAGKALVTRRLDPPRLERVAAAPDFPATSAVPALAGELCKLLRDYVEVRTGLGVRSEEFTQDDGTVPDTPTFGSNSSLSSFITPLRPNAAIKRGSVGGDTSLGLDDLDTEELTTLDDWLDDPVL